MSGIERSPALPERTKALSQHEIAAPWQLRPVLRIGDLVHPMGASMSW